MLLICTLHINITRVWVVTLIIIDSRGIKTSLRMIEFLIFPYTTFFLATGKKGAKIYNNIIWIYFAGHARITCTSFWVSHFSWIQHWWLEIWCMLPGIVGHYGYHTAVRPYIKMDAYFTHNLIPPKSWIFLCGISILASEETVGVGADWLFGVLVGVLVDAGDQFIHVVHKLVHY